MGLALPYGTIWVYEGVAGQVRGGGDLSGQFGNPIMELVTKICGDAALFQSMP